MELHATGTTNEQRAGARIPGRSRERRRRRTSASSGLDRACGDRRTTHRVLRVGSRRSRTRERARGSGKALSRAEAGAALEQVAASTEDDGAGYCGLASRARGANKTNSTRLHVLLPFGGQLLTAVGIDPNDCIYPIAFAVVEVESLKTWKWFLETLKNDLGIDNTFPWTIMTDKQKGLIPAVQQVFSESEHRFCVRHLYSNFQVHFKGENLKNQLWACARSSSVIEWNKNMDLMKALNKDAYEWLEQMPPNTWVRAFFSTFPKCDILLNNNCEVFNKYILEAREMPILSMLQRIKGQLMARHCNKQKEAEKFQGTVCPKIRKKIEKNSEMANTCFVLPAGKGIFQVQDKGKEYIVDISVKKCDCRRWDLTGIPCSHAISCLRHENIPSETVVPDCFTIEAFNRAYSCNIWPCSDMSAWEKTNGPEVKPPVYEKKVGRPPKSRRKAPHEVQGKYGPKLSKHGIEMHCRNCKGSGHNIAGCKLKKAELNLEQQVPNEPMPTFESEPYQGLDEGVITQEYHEIGAGSSQLFSQLDNTIVSQMMDMPTQCLREQQSAGPLPDCDYITNNQPTVRPMPLTTATKAGRLKRKTIDPKSGEGGTKKKPGRARQ